MADFKTQIEDLKAGTGPAAKAGDRVTVHYTGTLTDGTKFDSSRDRGQPSEFMVGGVIAGWTEALQLMKVGSKWEVYIPASLAYGATPPPGSKITPNAPLIFNLELIDVKEGAGAAR